MKAAFLAGLVVVLLLTAATRWLGLRTEAAATTQMGFKDARVKAVGELLRGMHHIKAAAWEPVFVGQVGSRCRFVRPAMLWAERCSGLRACSGANPQHALQQPRSLGCGPGDLLMCCCFGGRAGPFSPLSRCFAHALHVLLGSTVPQASVHAGCNTSGCVKAAAWPPVSVGQKVLGPLCMLLAHDFEAATVKAVRHLQGPHADKHTAGAHGVVQLLQKSLASRCPCHQPAKAALCEKLAVFPWAQLLAMTQAGRRWADGCCVHAVQVEAARRGEVQALSVLRYLDALSVYFWSATSVLFSFTTFALFVLTGAAPQHRFACWHVGCMHLPTQRGS